MVNQRNAVVSTIISVLNERGCKYEMNGPLSISEVMTESDKQKVISIICQGFKDDRIEMSTDAKVKYAADAELRKYVVGLVNNWVRKAPEFNSGNAYQAKNPGSRTGSGDPKLQALKALYNTVPEAHKPAVQAAINARLEELKPKIEIDTNLLPEHLRHLV
jgi:hypothetical protein